MSLSYTYSHSIDSASSASDSSFDDSYNLGGIGPVPISTSGMFSLQVTFMTYRSLRALD